VIFTKLCTIMDYWCQ